MAPTTSSILSTRVASAGRRLMFAVGCAAVVIVGSLAVTLFTTSRTTPAPVELAALSVTPPQASVGKQSGMLLSPAIVTLTPTLPVAAPPAPTHATAPLGPMFDSRPIKKSRTIQMLVTAYSPDTRSCGPFAHGITASGYSVWTNAMYLAAADTRVLPFCSVISIPGYHDGKPVPVLDRGGKIKGNHIDLLFPTNEQAAAWGTKRLTITVWEYAD